MGLTILLIEDDQFIRESTKEILAKNSYDIVVAQDGLEGLKVAKRVHPDLIICDIEMPELDGFGVYEILSKDPRFLSTPFIFLSGHSSLDDIRKGMELGVDDYLTKPFKKEELINAIEVRCEKSNRLKTFYEYQDKGIETAIRYGDGLKTLFGITDNYKTAICPKKEKIYNVGEAPSFLYFVKEGQIKITRESNEGKEFSVHVLGEGCFFGHQSILDDSKYSESAVAISPSEITKIPKENFLKLLYSDKSVAAGFIQFLNRQNERNENRLVSLAYDSVRRRTADVLLELYNNKKSTDGQIKLGRDDLASMVGTAKETVIRCLSEFKKDGAIEIEPKGISIISIEKLKKTYI